MLLLIVLFSPIFHVTYLYLLSFGAELRAFTFYNTAVYTKSMRLINHFCSLCSVFILSTHQFSMPQYAMGCCRVFFRILFLCRSRVFFLIVVLFDRFFPLVYHSFFLSLSADTQMYFIKSLANTRITLFLQISCLIHKFDRIKFINTFTLKCLSMYLSR